MFFFLFLSMHMYNEHKYTYIESHRTFIPHAKVDIISCTHIPRTFASFQHRVTLIWIQVHLRWALQEPPWSLRESTPESKVHKCMAISIKFKYQNRGNFNSYHQVHSQR